MLLLLGPAAELPPPDAAFASARLACIASCDTNEKPRNSSWAVAEGGIAGESGTVKHCFKNLSCF